MTKYLHNAFDIIAFLQFHPDNNYLIFIPSKIKNDFVATETYSNEKLSIENVLKLNNYKYYCDIIEKDILYSGYMPKIL